MSVITQNNAHDHNDHATPANEQSEREYFGFWIYVMTDCMIFATLFATYAVLSHNFAGRTEPHEVFDLGYVAIETLALLVSSFTFGLVMLNMHKGNLKSVKNWLFVTFILGAIFISMELHEFYKLAVHEGVTPQLSGYWSVFFTLLGTHGLHVACGMIWMIVMMVSLSKNGLTTANNSRLSMLSLFWHFLDIIWICVFSFVYLMGVFA